MSTAARRPLPTVADQFGVVTTEQARALGWTSDALRHAVRHERLDRLWRGVYAAPVAPHHEGRDRRRVQLAVGAALADTGVLVSHGPAAAVHGWPWWAPAPTSCVTHARELATTAIPGVHVHRARLDPLDRWSVGPLPVTSPARTVCDIAREHGTQSGVCVGDAALRAGDVRPVDLARCVTQARDWPGGRRLARLVELLDPRAESVLESRSRWAMGVVGLPAPSTQVALHDAWGRFVARVDFLWPRLRVVGEADGRGKYERREDLGAEKDREDAIRRLGLGVVRWGWRDLARFDVVAARFWQAVDDQAPYRATPTRWSMHQLPVAPFRHRAAPPRALVGVGGVIEAF